MAAKNKKIGKKKAQPGLTMLPTDKRGMDFSKAVIPPEKEELLPRNYITPHPEDLYKTPQIPTFQIGGKKKINWGNVGLSALSAIDFLIPEDEIKMPVVQPSNSYNPHPYGTGSQALAQDGITLSKTGYKRNSKDKNKPALRIPSNKITMEGVEFPVLGVDSTGMQQIMMPNENYQFPGEYVDEFPLAKKGKTLPKHGHKLPKGFEIDGKDITTKQRKFFNDLCEMEDGGEIAKRGKKMKKPKGQYISTSYQQGGEIEKANFEAKEISKRRGLFNAEAMHVGNQVPKYVDPLGNQLNSPIPSSRIKSYVPPDVTELQWDGEANLPSYVNPSTGYLEYTTKENFYSPRFQKSVIKDQHRGEMVKLEKGSTLPIKARGGLQIEDNQFTPLSSTTLQINGKPHEKGGTKLAYGNKIVEAEAGETVSIEPNGEAVIAGNLKNPLTGNKFKSDSKTLAKKEKKVDKILDYSTSLVNQANPYDKWENLKFNAGHAMMVGAAKKKNELIRSRTHLGDLQQAILDLSDENGTDPDTLLERLETAENGLKIPSAQDGKKLSMAQRHNNPGNIKFPSKKKNIAWIEGLGGVRGERDTITNDGTYYIKFPTIESGQRAMKELLLDRQYKNKTVAEAASVWTGGEPYKNLPKGLENRKISSLSADEKKFVFDAFTLGEDSKKYNWAGIGGPTTTSPITPQVPFDAGRVDKPKVGITPTNTPQTVQRGGPNFQINPMEDIDVPTDAEPLQFTQIIPEILAGATNKERPVWMQQYQPNLFQDYEVSLQDTRNRITSQGRASRQAIQGNPNAEAVLAGQEYQAISNVDAEEFRINQGISNDITNRNKALLNDAQLKNLQLADLQYTRQATASSKTKAVNQKIVNSLSSKVLQNQLENRFLQTYENLYPHFRYDDQYRLQKEGNPGSDYLQPIPTQPSTTQGDFSTKTLFDKNNALKSTTISTPSAIDTDIKEQRLKNIQNKNLQSIFSKGKYKKYGIPDVGLNFY